MSAAQRSPLRFRAPLVGVVLVAAVVLAVLLFKGHYSGPTCAPHSSRCEQTLDGHWIPSWYYTALQHAQSSRGAPEANGRQPSAAQLLAAGATRKQIAGLGHSAQTSGPVTVTRTVRVPAKP